MRVEASKTKGSELEWECSCPGRDAVALPARMLAPVPAEHGIGIGGSSGPVPGLGGGALLPTPSFSVSVERVNTSLSIGVSYSDLGSGTGTHLLCFHVGTRGSKGCPGVAYFQSYLLWAGSRNFTLLQAMWGSGLRTQQFYTAKMRSCTKKNGSSHRSPPVA